MSRLALSFSLVAVLSSVALADRAEAPHFAQPPHAMPSDVMEPPDLRLQPDVRLDRATLAAALIQIRKANLAAFRAYQNNGVFPSNSFKPGRLNVWRDADGHLCAAATIIKMSGHDDLVDRVAEQSNFIRLAEVRQGPLMDWILTSGFTQEEIAAIQEPFMPVVRKPVVEPPTPILVDAKLRKAEDARLRAKYRQVERMLVANEKRSIEVAVDRLMKHQELAWSIVMGGGVEG
jgi:hypothetical protein